MGLNVLLALAAAAAGVRAAAMLGMGGRMPGAWWAVLVAASVEFVALVVASFGRFL